MSKMRDFVRRVKVRRPRAVRVVDSLPVRLERAPAVYCPCGCEKFVFWDDNFDAELICPECVCFAPVERSDDFGC